jgi:hypothetical protein
VRQGIERVAGLKDQKAQPLSRLGLAAGEVVLPYAREAGEFLTVSGAALTSFAMERSERFGSAR